MVLTKRTQPRSKIMENAENIRFSIGKKLRHLREQAGFSQTKLAGMAGMVQPMINRFETGERKITVDHAKALAAALRIAPADLLPPGLLDTASPIVRSVPAGVQGVMSVLGADGAPIEETPVPPVLATARERYALYMPDNSMSPRYAAGTLLHVAPHKPASAGRGVVLVLKDGRRLVREMVYAESTHLQVKRYGVDPGTENYPADSVAAVHVIAGTVEA
jgi:transcriptional regulator with XRE-family HTH domain